jgi:hypothetical protein
MIAAIAAVVGAIVNVITSMAGLMIAAKLLLLGLFVIILPVVLNNFFYKILEIMTSFANSETAVLGTNPLSYQFTGLGAYLADHLQLPGALSIVLTAVSVRFILKSLRIF